MKNLILFFLLIFIFGCRADTDKPKMVNYQQTIPPLSVNEQKICDSLKTSALNDIRRGVITIAFNDTIKDIFMYKCFVSVLKSKFGFNYFRLDNMNNFETLPFKYCVQPIMDSVIKAKYGNNGKDSIINLAYTIAVMFQIRGNG